MIKSDVLNKIMGQVSIRERVRIEQRKIRTEMRPLNRAIRQIDNETVKLKVKCKEYSKTNDKKAMYVIARKIVNKDKQKIHMQNVIRTFDGIISQLSEASSAHAINKAMTQVTKVVVRSNKKFPLKQINKQAAIFELEREKMETMFEVTDDVINSAYEDEVAEDELVKAVFEELEIEFEASFKSAPNTSYSPYETSEYSELTERLNKLIG